MRKTKPTTCQHPLDDGNVYLCPFCNKGGWRTRTKLSDRDYFLTAAILLVVLGTLICGGLLLAHTSGHDVCIGYDPGEPCP